MSQEIAGIFDRLGTSQEYGQQRIKKLFAKSRLFGNYFAADSTLLTQIAARRGVHHLDNAVRLAG